MLLSDVEHPSEMSCFGVKNYMYKATGYMYTPDYQLRTAIELA
jgi:hypothetical protein